jgi:hypothetical protein
VGVEQILEIIDTIVVTSLLFIQKFAFSSCTLIIGSIRAMTDPQVQGASYLITFVALLLIGFGSIWWWFRRLKFLTSVPAPFPPRPPHTSLGDVFLFTIATFLIPPVLLYVCFFFLCWWTW